MRRRLTALLAAVLLSAPLLVAGAASAAAFPPDPTSNIEAPDYVFQGACASAPTSTGCTALFVRALNRARGIMGNPNYTLPTRFAYLTGRERLLVLTNQDRKLYGLVPLAGLNADLNASARGGVQHDRDPYFVKVNGQQYVGGASNWAAGSPPMTNPLYAYYLWMYDDGPGSGNLDCQHAGDPGCWGHRHGHLAGFGSQNKVLYGNSGGPSRFGYSWTDILEAFAPTAVTPLIPTVQGLNTHAVSPGDTVHVAGFGLSHTDRVTIAGRTATVLRKSQYALDVRVPAGSGSGYLLVTTNGGTSSANAASQLAYR